MLAEGSEKKERPERAAERYVESFRQELIVGGFSRQTLKMYLCYLNDFFNFVKKSPERVTHNGIIAYMAYKKEQGAKDSTMCLI